MKNKKEEGNTTADFTHLPHYAALCEYDPSQWICFGTLTHKHPTAGKTQIARFKTLMDTIGSLNHSFGRRLHWIVRVEGDDGSESESDVRTHIHFLLGSHKVTDGHNHQLTPAEACSFLEKVWEYGKAEVEPYQKERNGLGYVLKCPNGCDAKEWEDLVEVSPALMSHLIKKKGLETYASRDSLMVEILRGLRKKGVSAWFGDEVPRWRAA